MVHRFRLSKFVHELNNLEEGSIFQNVVCGVTSMEFNVLLYHCRANFVPSTLDV